MGRVFLHSSGYSMEQQLRRIIHRQMSVLRDGREITVAPDDLALTDVMVLRPGERAATDGLIKSARTSLDLSAITGESVLVEAGPGSVVYAGAINGDGAVEVEVTARANDSSLTRIVHIVEEAQERKSRPERRGLGGRRSPCWVAGTSTWIWNPKSAQRLRISARHPWVSLESCPIRLPMRRAWQHWTPMRSAANHAFLWCRGLGTTNQRRPPNHRTGEATTCNSNEVAARRWLRTMAVAVLIEPCACGCGPHDRYADARQLQDTMAARNFSTDAGRT